MGNTVVVHTRINSEIKKEANKIFNKIGLNMSQAIKLFLISSINKKGMPFDLVLTDEEAEEELKFATSIATVDGVPPSEEGKEIMKLYSKGIIDYETAQTAVEKLHTKK